jgi:hypothetical protein
VHDVLHGHGTNTNLLLLLQLLLLVVVVVGIEGREKLLAVQKWGVGVDFEP